MLIDTSFDFNTDAQGKDPDQGSPTLRTYHQLLWSKPLPTGHRFDLYTTTPHAYLHHRSALGEFSVSSDTIITGLARRASAVACGGVTQAQRAEFNRVGSTIGARIVFPGDRIDGLITINGARGFHPRIADRFDLTLECIRRHYAAQPHPLENVLQRYQAFFALFGDFAGYVEFFLLHDLLSADGSVRFFLPFDDFSTSPVPATASAYRRYCEHSVAFAHARNDRIHQWASTHLTGPPDHAKQLPAMSSKPASKRRRAAARPSPATSAYLSTARASKRRGTTRPRGASGC